AAARGKNAADGIVAESRLKFGGPVGIAPGQNTHAIEHTLRHFDAKSHGAERVDAPFEIRTFDRRGGRHDRDGISRTERRRFDAKRSHLPRAKSSRYLCR